MAYSMASPTARGIASRPERQSRRNANKKPIFASPISFPAKVWSATLLCTPHIRSIRDLKGQIIAVQRGNTSEPVVERLKAQGDVADVRVYPYDGIKEMLDDLDAGKIAAVMKLAPVMRWLTRDRPNLKVVQEGITVERLAISVQHGNGPLREALDAAQQRLAAAGLLDRLQHRMDRVMTHCWFGRRAILPTGKSLTLS